MRVGVCIIATGKYVSFINRLVKDIDRYFLLNHDIVISLFVDCQIVHAPIPADTRLNFRYYQIPPYRFPHATLYRYKIMTSVEHTQDFVFYIDADMGIVSEVGDEILGELVAVRHPGYFKGGWGSTRVDPKSKAFLPKERWGQYMAGGFQGGRTDVYVKAMEEMRDGIDEDEKNGIMAQWHDETLWNHYLSYHPPTTILDCSYCMPESINKRANWGIRSIKPRILALEKNTKLMRS